MKKYEYISIHAKAYVSLSRKYERLREQIIKEEIGSKRNNKIAVEMGLCAMYLGKERERLGFVLDFLKLEDITKEWRPNGITVYNGIRGELQELKFDE